MSGVDTEPRDYSSLQNKSKMQGKAFRQNVSLILKKYYR
jgi:hypothetical protein